MEINTTGEHVKADPVAWDLIQSLEEKQTELGLGEAQLYYDFPIFKDLDGVVVIAKVLLVSLRHGLIAIGTSDVTSRQENVLGELQEVNDHLDQVFSLLYSRLVRSKELRRTRAELKFPADAVLFAPLLESHLSDLPFETRVLFTYKQLEDFLQGLRDDPIPSSLFDQLIATIEGANGLIRPTRARDVSTLDTHSKGYVANKLESEIATFDQRQKHGHMSILDGLQRIRGLAGSGKTVVLAMKAALTHLRHPDADVLYTFYTRSLYQYVRRLITRFYRQFDDRDPDWTRLKVMHAWGGYGAEGVYFSACMAHGVDPISFSQASKMSRGNEFDFVCTELLENADIEAMYDYVIVDEGQDFPGSFLRLCATLVENNRVVYAYDDLQTIWQATVPTPAEIFGRDEQGRPLVQLSDDVVLYKCYRNPREVLVCAHALGFGIYGSRIVQMLENPEYWEDLGYEVIGGEFVEGSHIVIERPAGNSLMTISEAYQPDEIVQATIYDSFADEIQGIAQAIKSDMGDGLRPEDILVVVVDDRHAKRYLNSLAEVLSSLGIRCNNVHADPYGIRDFHKEGHVTLSTVHKAKGNEALMVYVVGVDALFASYASVRERNMLFTAMTRAKAWVRLSGIGDGAAICKEETSVSLQNSPYLRFTYPSEEELKIMRRDLAEKAVRKLKVERMLDKVLEEMSVEEVKRFIEQRSIKKGKRGN